MGINRPVIARGFTSSIIAIVPCHLMVFFNWMGKKKKIKRCTALINKVSLEEQWLNQVTVQLDSQEFYIWLVGILRGAVIVTVLWFDAIKTMKLNIYILEPSESRPVFSQQASAVCLEEHKYCLDSAHVGGTLKWQIGDRSEQKNVTG